MDSPNPKPTKPIEPVSFTIRRPTPTSTTPLSLSRDTSTGPDESDNNSSVSTSASGSFKVPVIPHLRVGNERKKEEEAKKKGSPLARGVAISASASGLSSGSRTRGIDVPSVVDSSDDDDDDGRDEPVTAFDRLSGALNESGTANGSKKRRRSESDGGGPLVIPALKNRDWRELARRRRGVGYVPGQGQGHGTTHTNTVVGQDSINTGPVPVGLQVKAKTKVMETRKEGDAEMLKVQQEVVEVVEESEDQKALRLVLAESSRGGDADEGDGPVIESIPMQQRPITEAEALKQDVEELPDSASLDDYARVPVAQFGAALLRGMGWKKDDVGIYLPEARPALLGIGAKEQEVYDDGSAQREKKKKRDLNLKGPYLPVKQVMRSGTGTPVDVDGRSRSPRRDRDRDRERGSRSRRGSRSPDYHSSGRERKRDRRD